MFQFIQSLKKGKLTPLQRFQKTVRQIQFVRTIYKNSRDLPTQAKLALLTPGRSRSEHEHDLIQRLMSRFNFFIGLKQKHGVEVFQGCCKNLYLRRYEADENVIKKGTDGNTFYVILGGKVSVIIYKPKNKISRASTMNIAMQNVDDRLDLYDELEIATLGIGDSFGELSLLDSKTTTTATIRSREKCEFACLDRKQFWEILGRIKRDELDQKLNFLQELPFLQNWYQQDLMTMSYHFKPLKVQRKSIIFNRGDLPQGIYFVLEGFIELWTIVKKSDNKGDGLFINQKSDNRSVLISHIPSGGIFGEEEFFGHSERQFTAMCGSMTAELYYIYKNELDRRVIEQKQKKVLEQQVVGRYGWRSSREKEFSEAINNVSSTLKITQSCSMRIKNIKSNIQKPQDKIQSKCQRPLIQVSLLQANIQLNNSFEQYVNVPQISISKRKIKNKLLENKLDIFERAKLLGMTGGSISKIYVQKQQEKQRQEDFLRTIGNANKSMDINNCLIDNHSNNSNSKQLIKNSSQSNGKLQYQPRLHSKQIYVALENTIVNNQKSYFLKNSLSQRSDSNYHSLQFLKDHNFSHQTSSVVATQMSRSRSVRLISDFGNTKLLLSPMQGVPIDKIRLKFKA